MAGHGASSTDARHDVQQDAQEQQFWQLQKLISEQLAQCDSFGFADDVTERMRDIGLHWVEHTESVSSAAANGIPAPPVSGRDPGPGAPPPPVRAPNPPQAGGDRSTAAGKPAAYAGDCATATPLLPALASGAAARPHRGPRAHGLEDIALPPALKEIHDAQRDSPHGAAKKFHGVQLPSLAGSSRPVTTATVRPMTSGTPRSRRIWRPIEDSAL
mmetsp:Transcript_37686/g.98705  ORF Transcript_37686/g.98705 Transcript_37686/m.98705 type:complete len:215 (+) Transcript_37686:33-677(+)